MTLYDLTHSLVSDTLASTAGFQGELVLCVTIVLILLLRIPGLTSRVDSFYVMLAGSAVALYVAGPWHAPVERPSELFTGLLVYDSFTVYFRTLLFFFAVAFAIFTRISGVPDRDAAPDVYCLVLGATLGMCLMASANHMLIVFLGVEMASVPSYALAGLIKGRRQSSEAALKYAVYGAGAAGIMLYGISLLAGVLGSVHMPTMAIRLAELLQPANYELGRDTHMVLALGGIMVMVGIAFKLAAVPFHFWCPDVFEGASAEVNAFLSVASKAAALALLARVAIGLGYVSAQAPPEQTMAVLSVADAPHGALDSTDEPAIAHPETVRTADEAAAPLTRAEQNQALAPARGFIAQLLAFVAIITCTFGNLAAYGQTNIKRLLAYSTIAQAGYMMMPVPAAMLLADTDPQAAGAAIGSMAFYAGVYLFMNLGAFAIVAFLRNTLHSEEIADYAGLIRRSPIVAVCFSTILISLIGLPPLAGFVGKLQIFYYLVQSQLWIVLVVAGLNTAISLVYYLRVVKIMTIDPEAENRIAEPISFVPGTFVVLVTLPLVFLGIWWNRLAELATGRRQPTILSWRRGSPRKHFFNDSAKQRMDKLDTYQTLNRLLTIIYRSLPMYLTFACPWTHRGDEKAVATLGHIVEDQKQLANRIAEHILKTGPIDMGEYPLDFPDTHDLGLDYLIVKLVNCQKDDVAALEQCVADIRNDRAASALAEEALGSARGHLESLEELAGHLTKHGS